MAGSLHGQAPAGCILRVPSSGIIGWPRLMALIAVLTAQSLVSLAAAFIPVFVYDSRSGLCSGRELQILHGSTSIDSAARSSALSMLEPIDSVVAGPLADSPCHFRDVLRHV